MKGLLIGTALATVLGGTALAADLGQPINPFVPQTPVYSWTGAYLGLQGGYGWGDSTLNYDFDDGLLPPIEFPYSLDVEPSGFVGGGHLGALYQWNWLVLGVEGDIEFNTMDDSANFAVVDLFGFTNRASFDVEYNWSASARGRVGVAFDRVLVYGTGGYAYSDLTTTFTTVDPFGFRNTNSTDEGVSGWTAGGGFDALVGYNLSARLEYRYTDLKDIDTFTTANDTITIENNFHAIRAGLSYHF